MPYDSRTYRVLIASPADVDEERDIAARVIQEWNDLYSYSRKVVLLALRWETHTAPEYGTRPQEVVNRAIVDNCDLLLGIFWTRIGTPTGSSESGTLEEIERVAKAGKPAMLYFSKVGVDPNGIEVHQWTRLKDFKDRIQSTALTESFKSQIEFRDKFARQLELQVRELQKADSVGQPPPLSLMFSSGDLKQQIAPTGQLNIEIPRIIGLDLSDKEPGWAQRIQEASDEWVKSRSNVSVLLVIGNSGSAGIRNLYVEMSISVTSDGVTAVSDTLGKKFLWALNGWPTIQSEAGALKEVDGGWELSFEWDALQPQRVRPMKPLFIWVEADAKVSFTAKVFADSFPEPVILAADLNIGARLRHIDLTEAVPDIESFRKPPSDAYSTLFDGTLKAK
jgi:hypothetical protein